MKYTDSMTFNTRNKLSYVYVVQNILKEAVGHYHGYTTINILHITGYHRPVEHDSMYVHSNTTKQTKQGR